MENYKELLSNNKWVLGIFISILRTLSGTVTGVFFTAMVAFGLSYRKLRFAKGYYIFMIVAMYFHGGLIPYHVVLRGLGLLNTFWVYIVPGFVKVFYVLVMISFFREIPAELEEAAAIDCASDLYTFVRIILPVSKPVLATVALFLAVGHWNSWIDSACFVTKTELRTLSYLKPLSTKSTRTLSKRRKPWAS